METCWEYCQFLNSNNPWTKKEEVENISVRKIFYLCLDQGIFHGFCSWSQSFWVNHGSRLPDLVLDLDLCPAMVQTQICGSGHVPDPAQNLVELGSRGGLCCVLCFHSVLLKAASEECCPAGLCLTSQSEPEQFTHKGTISGNKQIIHNFKTDSVGSVMIFGFIQAFVSSELIPFCRFLCTIFLFLSFLQPLLVFSDSLFPLPYFCFTLFTPLRLSTNVLIAGPVNKKQPWKWLIL